MQKRSAACVRDSETRSIVLRNAKHKCFRDFAPFWQYVGIWLRARLRRFCSQFVSSTCLFRRAGCPQKKPDHLKVEEVRRNQGCDRANEQGIFARRSGADSSGIDADACQIETGSGLGGRCRCRCGGSGSFSRGSFRSRFGGRGNSATGGLAAGRFTRSRAAAYRSAATQASQEAAALLGAAGDGLAAGGLAGRFASGLTGRFTRSRAAAHGFAATKAGQEAAALLGAAGGRLTAGGLTGRFTGSRFASGLTGRFTRSRAAAYRFAATKACQEATALRATGGRSASRRFTGGLAAGRFTRSRAAAYRFAATKTGEETTALRATGGRSAGRRFAGCGGTGGRRARGGGTSLRTAKQACVSRRDDTQHHEHERDANNKDAIHSRTLQLDRYRSVGVRFDRPGLVALPQRRPVAGEPRKSKLCRNVPNPGLRPVEDLRLGLTVVIPQLRWLS